MRRTAFLLGAMALFSLGATSSTDCLSTLLPILTPPVIVSFHAVNNAYQPVTVELLVTDGSSTTLAAARYAVADVDAAANSAATQLPVDSAVAPGGQIKIGTALPCAVISGPIALKATYKDAADAEISATSPKLYFGDDYSCGDRVNFIIRPAAMVGIVVGYEVVKGGAEPDPIAEP